MAFDLHTIDVMGGSTALSMSDRLRLGFLTGVAVPGATGEMIAGEVEAVGAGYTSIPTGTAAGGTGGTITPSMALATSAAAAAGTTYAPGDTITTTGGTASQQIVLEVLTTKAVTAPAVGSSGGSGYAVGDQITLQNGLVVQVATLSTTAVATVTIVNGGAFTTNNTTANGLTQVSTTGSGSGAEFTMTAAKYGVNTYAVQNAGSFSALPSSPISQGSTSGSGSGFQLTASTWQLESFTATGGTGYADGAAVTFAGGAGSGAAGHISTEPLGDEVTIAVGGLIGLPSSYTVQVCPNGPCLVAVTDKTTTGFNVTLSPPASGQAVGASAIDILVVG